LRPLRGREPEGMWNLVSIVKELFRKRDKNSIPLLRIITSECVNLDQIIHLWFLIKVSPLYNERGNYNQRQHNHNHNHHTPPVHQACASLLDEIVSLWRIACLNPIHSIENKTIFKDLLTNWQKQSYEKLRKYCNSAPDKLHLLRRLDPELFSAFQPAIDACQMTWSRFDFTSSTSFKRLCIDSLPAINNQNVIVNAVEAQVGCVNNRKKSGSSSSEGFCEDTIKPVVVEPALNDDTVFDHIETLVTTSESQKLEILFSRCEALYGHGYSEQACILAKILAEYLLSNYNNNEKISDDFINCKNVNCCGDSGGNVKSKYITNFQSCILWRSVLLSTVLLEYNNYQQLAFRIGIFALEMPRQPASTKALEVKLFNQEQDLVLLLKRIPIGEYELAILRDRAKRIKDYLFNNINFNKCKCNNTNYLPVMLSSFIFDVLCNDKNANSADELIGFDAAVSGIGYKPNVNETQHGIYCEGNRRQKGELAITLLLSYKDDQTRLLKIMDKILDKEIHDLFKAPTNPFQPNLKRIQMNNLHKNEVVDPPPPPPPIVPTSVGSTIVSAQQVQQLQVIKTPTEVTPKPSVIQPLVTNSKILNNIKYSAIDSLSSGWEESESETPNLNSRLLETKFRCLNLNNNNNNKKSTSFDSSAPETTSSDNSPTISRKNKVVQAAAANIVSKLNENTTEKQPMATIIASKDEDSDHDSGESLSSGNGKSKIDDNISSIATILDDVETSKAVNMTTKPWVDGSFNEYIESASEKSTEPSNTPNIVDQTDLNEILTSMLTDNPNDFVNFISRVATTTTTTTTTNNTALTTTANNNKTSRSGRAKNKSPVYPNQPSEALAHFMFDFSKTLLSKAGGPISTSIFLNQNNTGPHRNLHMCAFLIALYALGLHNCVQSNWLSRTYSSHVSWINGQAAEIGYPAICILIECWQDHLTPSECALLADRVSRGRDTMAVKAAAELALSSLKYAHSLTLQEIQRALVQCKEQNSDMLQRGCLIVENSVKEGNNINLADVLFEVAKRWDDLYVESMRNKQPQVNNNQLANDIIMDHAIVSSSIVSNSSLQQQQQASAAVAAAAAVAVNNTYIQPSSLQHHQQQQQQQQMNNIDSMIHSQFNSYMHQQQQQQSSTQQQAAAPFAFAVQTYPQYVTPQQQGSMQNMFIPAMYTAYGTIVPSSPGGPAQQNILYQNQNNHSSYPVPQMNIYPANVGGGYLFQNQITQMMSTNANTQMQNQHLNQSQQRPLEVNMRVFFFEKKK
jgi:hypothetical protein